MTKRQARALARRRRLHFPADPTRELVGIANPQPDLQLAAQHDAAAQPEPQLAAQDPTAAQPAPQLAAASPDAASSPPLNAAPSKRQRTGQKTTKK